MTDAGWTWDPSLYAGSAAYYPSGRVAYPRELAVRLASVLGLDGTGRLLDVGCGPGSLTLLLAPLFEHAVGIDADPDMLAQAARLAEAHRVPNTSWEHRRGEELPAGLGTFRMVGFAQSFHWMDRRRVAATVRTMIDAGGALVHVHAATHQGVDSDRAAPHPRPPRAAIDDLVRRHLGPVRRAGATTLPCWTPGGEDSIYRAAGFTRAHRFEVPGGTVTRSADEVVASVFSLSSSAPHLFGDRIAEFEAELRALLHRAGPTDTFSETMREIAVDVWRP